MCDWAGSLAGKVFTPPLFPFSHNTRFILADQYPPLLRCSEYLWCPGAESGLSLSSDALSGECRGPDPEA